MANSVGIEKPIRKQLSDEVASYLREAIVAGELEPGESIRAEAVGDLLSVSATPVREALHTLRVEGFLELVPRKGFMVAPLSAKDILDIFAAHALIAGELTARAAQRASKGQIDKLQALHEDVMQAAERVDHEALEQRNHRFHSYLYEMADSERLIWSLKAFLRYVPRAFYAQIKGWPETTTEDHTAVMDAILAKDPDAAREAMIIHIRNSGETLAEYYDARRNDK